MFVVSSWSSYTFWPVGLYSMLNSATCFRLSISWSCIFNKLELQSLYCKGYCWCIAVSTRLSQMTLDKFQNKVQYLIYRAQLQGAWPHWKIFFRSVAAVVFCRPGWTEERVVDWTVSGLHDRWRSVNFHQQPHTSFNRSVEHTTPHKRSAYCSTEIAKTHT